VDTRRFILSANITGTEVKWSRRHNVGTIVVKFEEINLKFKKFVNVRDVIKFEKVRDPHSVTAASRSHSLLFFFDYDVKLLIRKMSPSYRLQATAGDGTFFRFIIVIMLTVNTAH